MGSWWSRCPPWPSFGLGRHPSGTEKSGGFKGGKKKHEFNLDTDIIIEQRTTTTTSTNNVETFRPISSEEDFSKKQQEDLERQLEHQTSIENKNADIIEMSDETEEEEEEQQHKEEEEDNPFDDQDILYRHGSRILDSAHQLHDIDEELSDEFSDNSRSQSYTSRTSIKSLRSVEAPQCCDQADSSRPDLLKTASDYNKNGCTCVTTTDSSEVGSDKLQEELYGELVQRFGPDQEYDEKQLRAKKLEEDKKDEKTMSIELIAEHMPHCRSSFHTIIVPNESK